MAKRGFDLAALARAAMTGGNDESSGAPLEAGTAGGPEASRPRTVFDNNPARDASGSALGENNNLPPDASAAPNDHAGHDLDSAGDGQGSAGGNGSPEASQARTVQSTTTPPGTLPALPGSGAGVSESDTVTEIPARKIKTNDANFYEMSELEDLAASIELVGLLHPVLVMPDGGDGGYILIDGERRFRAMTELLGRTSVPCIVRRPAGGIIEELMLIEANRTQRRMSDAELSKQAERFTELLAQLRDSGVEIPGRLRDRTAEALGVSASKLARLHAIREKLRPALLKMFDEGKLSESVAYEYSKMDRMGQAAAWSAGLITAEDVRRFAARRKEAAGQVARGSTSFPQKAVQVGLPPEGGETIDGGGQGFAGDGGSPEASPARTVRSTTTPRGTLPDLPREENNTAGHALDSAGEDVSELDTDEFEELEAEELDRTAFLVHWHRTCPEDMPPEAAGYGKAILLWGDGGLHRTPDFLARQTIEVSPAHARWWAVIEGPKEEHNE